MEPGTTLNTSVFIYTWGCIVKTPMVQSIYPQNKYSAQICFHKIRKTSVINSINQEHKAEIRATCKNLVVQQKSRFEYSQLRRNVLVLDVFGDEMNDIC